MISLPCLLSRMRRRMIMVVNKTFPVFLCFSPFSKTCDKFKTELKGLQGYNESRLMWSQIKPSAAYCNQIWMAPFAKRLVRTIIWFKWSKTTSDHIKRVILLLIQAWHFITLVSELSTLECLMRCVSFSFLALLPLPVSRCFFSKSIIILSLGLAFIAQAGIF